MHTVVSDYHMNGGLILVNSWSNTHGVATLVHKLYYIQETIPPNKFWHMPTLLFDTAAELQAGGFAACTFPPLRVVNSDC